MKLTGNGKVGACQPRPACVLCFIIVFFVMIFVLLFVMNFKARIGCHDEEA